jgi:VanZ family protein
VNEKTGRALPKVLPLLGIGIFGVLYGMLLKRKSLCARKEIACLTLIFACYAGLFSMVAKVPLEQAHLVEYSVLSVLVYLALSRYGQFGSIAGWGLALVVAVGIADEMYQWYLPTRFFDVRDIFVNSISGLLGFALVGLFTANSSDART